MSKINNINRREFLEIFGTCSCGLLITSCSTAPITERKQLKLIPEPTLNRQAAQMYASFKKKTKLSNDKKKLEEIKEIGSRIEEAVSAYFISKNQNDPTYNFQWDYVLVDNDKIIRCLSRFKMFDIPILIGLSRKSFLSIDNDKPISRLESSLSVASIAINNGADIIRVHDIE